MQFAFQKWTTPQLKPGTLRDMPADTALRSTPVFRASTPSINRLLSAVRPQASNRELTQPESCDSNRVHKKEAGQNE